MENVQGLISRLTAMTEKLAAVRSMNELAVAVHRIVDTTIAVDRSGVFLLDPESGALKLHYAVGFSEEEKIAAEKTAWDRHPGRVMRTGQMIHVPDIDADTQNLTQDSPRSFRVRSRLFLPINHDELTIGTLGLASAEVNHFGAFDIAMLQYAAATAGFMYKNIVDNMALVQALERAEAQKREIQSLSSPVVEVWQGILVLPLIGRVDEARSGDITTKLLDAVSQKAIETVILDLTGIEAIDEASLDALQKIAAKVKLLGGVCLFSGLSAAMAFALAQSNANEAARNMATFASLKRALECALLQRRRERRF